MALDPMSISLVGFKISAANVIKKKKDRHQYCPDLS